MAKVENVKNIKVSCLDLFLNERVGYYCGQAIYDKHVNVFVPHGLGSIKLEDGDAINGQFIKGEFKMGTYIFANGSMAVIELIKKRDAFSYKIEKVSISCPKDVVNVYYNTAKYSGEIKGPKRNGIGNMYLPSGEIYEGGWKEDKIHGIGYHTTSSGKREVLISNNGEIIYTLKCGKVSLPEEK